MIILLHWFGPMKIGRPLKPITQLLIIGVIITGAIIFIFTSVLPFLSELEQRATEEVTILTRTGSLCQINTKDEAMPSKMITNCELEEGAKVMVSYRDGLPFAKIELP